MPFTDMYRNQVELLVQTLPQVAEEECFALKGSTAINLFVRDMPRLSVDIDRPSQIENILCWRLKQRSNGSKTESKNYSLGTQ